MEKKINSFVETITKQTVKWLKLVMKFGKSLTRKRYDTTLYIPFSLFSSLSFSPISLNMPCPFKTWASMGLPNFLSLIVLSNFYSFEGPFCFLWCEEPFLLSVYSNFKFVTRWFPPLLFPSVCYMSVRFTEPSFLITFLSTFQLSFSGG